MAPGHLLLLQAQELAMAMEHLPLAWVQGLVMARMYPSMVQLQALGPW